MKSVLETAPNHYTQKKKNHYTLLSPSYIFCHFFKFNTSETKFHIFLHNLMHPSHFLFLSMFPLFSRFSTILGRFWTLVSYSFLCNQLFIHSMIFIGCPLLKAPGWQLWIGQNSLYRSQPLGERQTLEVLSEDGTSEPRGLNDEKLVMKTWGKEHSRQRESSTESPRWEGAWRVWERKIK